MKCLLFSLSLLVSCQLFAQSDELLSSLPATKEEYTASEPKVINTINWLERTPLNEDVDKRKAQGVLFVSWLTNSPEVTIVLDAKVTPFMKKNPELLINFMGGYTRFVLENSYSKDAVQANLAGVRSAIKVYRMGNGLKKDKEMEKIIGFEDRGELEGWIKDQLGKK